jgi:hypothetical protein
VGIREKLNENPNITTGITIGIIVLALAFIVWQIMGGDGMGTPQTKMYYSADDGATYFSDDVSKVPPYDHEGKQAVRAYVFKCSDGTPFVAYLERMAPEVRDKYEAALKLQSDPEKGPQAMMDAETMSMESMEVKKPGGSKWVKRTNPEADTIVQVACPDGTTNGLSIVFP